MAEYLFKSAVKKSGKAAQFTARSCGVCAAAGCDMPENAKRALRALNVRFKAHKSKTITPALIEKSDLIVCMTDSHKDAALALEPQSASKVKTIAELSGGGDVPDPFGGSLELYLKTAEYLLYVCGDIIKYFE
jgi:protein-tyrosine phosphatase